MTPEYIIEICVAIDIAILGIAYPIIVDKISNIGDKFSSQYIPELFNNEFPQSIFRFRLAKKVFSISIFKLTLYSTLISLFFLIFKFSPSFGWNNWLINNSAKTLVLLLSTTLTIFFFIWLDKVVLFNGNPKSLLMHIKKRYESIKKDTDIKEYYLKAINEFTFYALEKQDEHLQETLLEFYYAVFKNIRRKHDKNNPLKYPIDIYFLVNRLNKEAVNIENNKLTAIEHRAVSGIWLLGEDFENIEISQETYSWLWRNIYNICDHPRLVKMFWANSFQYFNSRLKNITTEHDFGQGIIINQKAVNKRRIERERFLEFHFALGGLLYYRQQYKTLKYLFQYSQSIPPQYVLLPGTMSEIFKWFEHFSNEFNHDTPIDSKYGFPELDNLGNSRQVIYWICSYIAILFIRQYSLHKYYTYQDFTGLPALPDEISELSGWLDNISYFERCLNDVVNNKSLIEELEYDKIVEQEKGNFEQFIKDLKESIKNKIGEQKLNAKLSEEKIRQFYEKSNEIITNAFKAYDPIFRSNNDILNNELKLSVNGAKTLMSKSAFTEGDIPFLNFDTYFAGSIVHNSINRLIPNSFFVASTKKYLLNEENILESLNKLIGNNNDIIIIGLKIGYNLQQILTNSLYKNHIKFIPSYTGHSQNVLFVLKEKYLPAIEHKDIKTDEKQELQLIPINEDLKIYASVIDINKEENIKIKEQWNSQITSDDSDLKVQIAISFLSVIYWKEDREVVQINIASEYEEQGIQNEINDIEPLK